MDTATKHPKIALTPCNSSIIHGYGHDPVTNTLVLQFKSKGGPGNIHHFSNYTEADYKAFLAADSKGAHFGKHIKAMPEKHPGTKVWDHKAHKASA